MRSKHSNNIQQDDIEKRMWSIITSPKFAIGQRCILLQTAAGNVLWDCVTYLDEETVEFIKAKGGLKAIVISHPHYYSTHLDWAKTFECPVYFSAEDKEWISRKDDEERRKFVTGVTEEVVDGVTAIKACLRSFFRSEALSDVGRSAATSLAAWCCIGTRNFSLLILSLLLL